MLTFMEGLVGSSLKTRLSSQVVTSELSLKKHIRARILAKSAKCSCLQSGKFGRPSSPTGFGRQCQMNRVLKANKNDDSPKKTEGNKRIHP